MRQGSGERENHIDTERRAVYPDRSIIPALHFWIADEYLTNALKEQIYTGRIGRKLPPANSKRENEVAKLFTLETLNMMRLLEGPSSSLLVHQKSGVSNHLYINVVILGGTIQN